MVRWTGYVTVFILLNLNDFIESSVKRQSVVCLKELHAFAVAKRTLNVSADSTRICPVGLGCCNKSIENGMKNQVRKKLKLLIHIENEGVKRKFKTIYDDLKAACENALHQTSESAIKFIQKPQVKLASQAIPHIRALFKDLQHYLTKKDLKIENATSKFFKSFFVVTYKNSIRDSSRSLPSRFSKCLKDKIDVIKPFRKAPQEITTMFKKDLLPVQVFLHALQTADHLLEVSKNVEFSELCSDTLVKMNYCSLCDSLKDVKPCFNYCSDTLRQCLDPYTKIQRYWYIFIRKLSDLSNSIQLSKSKYRSGWFRKLQQKFEESILNSWLSSDHVYTHCGNVTQKDSRNKIVSLKKKQNDASSRDRGTRANGDLYIAGDSQNPGSLSLQNQPVDYDVTRRFDIVMRNVSDARIYFGNLHSHLCTSDLAASVNEQSKCWNGTGVTIRYNTSYNPAKNVTLLNPTNSEILTKGVLQLLQKIIGDIKKAEEVVNTFFTSGSGESESGSGSGGEPWTYYGSSNDKNDTIASGSGCEDEDDEDCAETSGTISGDNADEDENKDPDDSSGKITTQSPVLHGRNSGKCWSPCSLTLFGLLFCYLIFAR